MGNSIFLFDSFDSFFNKRKEKVSLDSFFTKDNEIWFLLSLSILSIFWFSDKLVFNKLKTFSDLFSSSLLILDCFKESLLLALIFETDISFTEIFSSSLFILFLSSSLILLAVLSTLLTFMTFWDWPGSDIIFLLSLSFWFSFISILCGFLHSPYIFFTSKNKMNYCIIFIN